MTLPPTDRELIDLGWSDRHLKALSALFGTIAAPTYEGESERHARLAAAALSEVVEPSDLRQLRVLLSVFEAPVGAPTLNGIRAFSVLSREQRERVLHAWSTSRLPQRRTFFQTIKRLGAFFAYADPGMDGTNKRWAPMGYEVPDHPLPEPSAVQAAILRPDSAPAPLSLEAEVVVVGSGAGGGVVAARLAELGHDVLVVEAGPFVTEAEMPRDELDAFTRLYLDHGMTASKDLAVAILAGAALGGGTLINWTTCFEPPDWLRSEWTTKEGIEGFDSADTDADISRLRLELGFSPPPSIGPKDQAILDGAKAHGWDAAPTERSADDCGDCGACGFGCRRGAKKSGQRLHLAMAAQSGARILSDARVDRVAFKSGVLSSVDGELVGGRPFSVKAQRVVLAAGALRTPLILLRSAITHQAIGRNLYLHPTVAVAARYERDVLMWRDTMQAARSLQFVADGFLIESAPPHPGLIALAFPWQGSAGLDELMQDVRRYAPFIGIVRDQDPGRVKLSGSGRARIDYRITKRDAATAREALVAMARIGRSSGAKRLVALGTPAAWHDVTPNHRLFDAYLDQLRVFDFSPNRGAVFSAHQMGTARAGEDAKTCVTDPWGRVRGARNLYVADASIFPTALGVNPMVTVMTLAARVARAVHEDY